jgi:hypothetical protein
MDSNKIIEDIWKEIVDKDFSLEEILFCDKPKIKRATIEQIANQPKVTTEQALKGYDYLRRNSKRVMRDEEKIK